MSLLLFISLIDSFIFYIKLLGGAIMKIETKCLHEGYKPKNGETRALPIYQSTTYTYDSTDQVGQLFDLTAEGHMYSRISNPTVGEIILKLYLERLLQIQLFQY